LAKHRADDLFGVRGKPPSFRSVVVLAVVGAVAASVLIASLTPGDRPKSLPQANSTNLAVVPTPSEPAVYQGVPEPSASPSSPAPSPSPSISKSAKPSKSPSGRPPTAVAAEVKLVAHYVVSGESNAGFGATVEIRNSGAAAATWVVEITYGSNVTVASVWNAKMERSGNTYRFRANSGSGLGSSQKVQFGYIAAAQRGSGKPVRCTVNGRACE
jgi:endoglucanase